MPRLWWSESARRVHRAGDGGGSGSWWPAVIACDEFGPREISNQSQTGAMGDDSQNAYGGSYAAGNPYGAVAPSQSPEEVAKELGMTWRSKRVCGRG
jgi:hypothetical protein